MMAGSGGRYTAPDLRSIVDKPRLLRLNVGSKLYLYYYSSPRRKV